MSLKAYPKTVIERALAILSLKIGIVLAVQGRAPISKLYEHECTSTRAPAFGVNKGKSTVSAAIPTSEILVWIN